MADKKSQLKDKAVSTVKAIDAESQRRYPQPANKPVYNNRIVYGAGLATGLVIGIWIGMFFCMFLPMVMG